MNDSSPSRRSILLRSTSLAVGALATKLAPAIEPFSRPKPLIKGLGLTTYSLKRHMRYWWGKPTNGKLGKMDMLDFLEYCAKLDLDGAEITSYFFQEPLETSYLHAVRRRTQILGLDITGAAMGNNFSHPPTSDAGKKHLAYYRSWIDHFAELGAPVVRIFASRGRPKGASDEQVITNVLANFEEALPYAERRGIFLGLENHDFVRNIDYLLRIVRKVESKWFGIIWDSANLAPTPDPYADLARIAPYAITAQVKVMTSKDGKHVPADYGRMVEILRKANFRGYLIFEYEEPEDPFTAIPRHVAELRKVLDAARRP